MMRQLVIFSAALIAFFGSLSAVFVTREARDYDLRGYVDATQTTDLPYRLPRLGVNADLFQYAPDELPRHLEWMQEAHITWVRQFVYWDDLEPQMGAFDWSQWDAIVDALQDYPDLQLIVVFMNSPQWARANNHPTAPPDDPTFIVPFLRAFSERYGDSVDYYQVWDEPNLDDTWGLENPKPAEYVALLAEAYQAIHSADLDATVIAAALAPTKERSGQNIADILYLEMMYQLGADDYFDAVAAKPYGFDATPDDRTVDIDTLNFSRIIALREVMLAYGDGNTALWASNWGWNSLPSDWEYDPSIWGAVTEQQRIDYTLTALERAEREWPWLGGMILHHWQPDVAYDNPMWGFALIDQTNTPKSLWSALANRDIASGATNGLYHPRTAFARYSGIWTFGELGADIGWLETTDSQLEFDFSGHDIALVLREDDYFAFAYSLVDGEQANATPKDSSGNSYILLRSATRQPELSVVPVSRGLSDSDHTLSVVFDKGWDRWALASYAVSDGNLSQSYNRQLTIAWATLLLSLTAVIISGRQIAWKKFYSRLSPLPQYLDFTMQTTISIVTSLALLAGMLLTWGEPIPHIVRRVLWQPYLPIILTGGLVVLKPGFLLVVVTAFILFVFIYNRLEIGLLLVVLYAPFFLFPVELYTFAFPMAELLLLITTGAWIGRLFAQWGRERQSSNPDYPLQVLKQFNTLDGLVIVYVVLGILSLLWASRLDPAITELRKLFIEPALFYFILRTISPTKDTYLRIIYALIAASVLVSIIGLYLYIRGEAIITAEAGARRLASVYGSPNNVGLLLGRAVPFVFTMALIYTRASLKQVIATCVVGLLIVTALLTQSVGAMLFGIPAGLATVTLLVWKRKAIPVLIVAGIVGVVAVAGLTQVSARFASLLDLSSGTNFIRLRIWESSFDIIRDNPIKGLGLDQFLYEFRGHYIRPDAIYDPDLSHPHNIILDFWIRLGIAGVVWIVALQVIFWRRMVSAYQNTGHDLTLRIVVIGTMGCMAALLAHGLIDNSVFVDDLVYIFMILVAIAADIPTQSATHNET